VGVTEGVGPVWRVAQVVGEARCEILYSLSELSVERTGGGGCGYKSIVLQGVPALLFAWGNVVPSVGPPALRADAWLVDQATLEAEGHGMGAVDGAQLGVEPVAGGGDGAGAQAQPPGGLGGGVAVGEGLEDQGLAFRQFKCVRPIAGVVAQVVVHECVLLLWWMSGSLCEVAEV
jgi:hypothetical protein